MGWKVWKWDNEMHRGLFIIKFHGKVRDADFKKIRKANGQGESRHVVTSRS